MTKQSKEILKNFEAIKALEKGVNEVCDAVKITLGPKGRNVVLDRQGNFPLITNDGVTIAKEVELENPFENMGANLIKQVSIKTNDSACDGTTTACVLAQKIVNEGVKNYTAGANPIILKKGIKKATEVVLQELEKQAIPVQDNRAIFQVASISAGDEEIGELISKAVDTVGKDGVISVEDGKTFKTELKVVEGMQLDRGYLSPYMATNTEKMEAELSNSYILITDNKIHNMQEIMPILEQVAKQARPLLIIAEDIENDVLATLVLNKLRGALNIVAIKSPSYGERRKAFLKDIATLTGGTVITQETALEIKDCTLSHLGEAGKIIVTKDSCVISHGTGNPEHIQERSAQIKLQIKSSENDFDKAGLEERLAKLTGGIAVIEVACTTEVEMLEKKLRIEDAISATKSAIAEGIVCGGGVALINCKPALLKFIKTLSGDEKTGAEIVLNSLSAPLKQICENAGLDGGVVEYNILRNKKKNYGFNALDNSYVDMIKAGIIDPAKVTKSAIGNATSVAATLLTTQVIIANVNTSKTA